MSGFFYLYQMARILSIDYGIKRSGIAITDEMQMIASGLTTIATIDIFNFLKNYFETEKVETVIIGEPKQMNGQPSESAVFINEFINNFGVQFPDMPLVKVDERFTSKMAFQTMIDSGLKKNQRKNKALIDEIAATIILQDYLNYKK
jgi:putative holliday junction resolvase